MALRLVGVGVTNILDIASLISPEWVAVVTVPVLSPSRMNPRVQGLELNGSSHVAESAEPQDFQWTGHG